MENVIVANNLSAKYNSKIIWQNASFEIKSGEFIGLLGPNGAGKTTLFRILLGLNSPSSGDVTILNKKVLKGNQNIGYVPQRRIVDVESKLFSIEYVKLGLSGHKWGLPTPKELQIEEKQALAALKLVDADEFAYRPIGELSGGEQQKVFLAQALIGKPKILLLDEPLSNLDIKRGNQLIKLISSIARKENIAVMLIAHDINPLLPYLDRIIYIANHKVASGEINNIITSQSLSKLYNSPVEVIKDSKGRIAVLGTEEAHHHAQ